MEWSKTTKKKRSLESTPRCLKAALYHPKMITGFLVRDHESSIDSLLQSSRNGKGVALPVGCLGGGFVTISPQWYFLIAILVTLFIVRGMFIRMFSMLPCTVWESSFESRRTFFGCLWPVGDGVPTPLALFERKSRAHPVASAMSCDTTDSSLISH